MKRTVSLVISIISVALIVHTLIYLIPGDPALAIMGEYASTDDIARIRSELSLDQSFWRRFAAYLGRLLYLDLGNSVYTGEPVMRLIVDRFPATLALATFAMIIAAIAGVLAGTAAAVWKKSWMARLILWISSLCISTPIFVSCFALSFVFSYCLGLFPPSGKQGMDISYLVLPSLALASRSLALIIRVVRNELIEILDQNYIKSARALGFPETRIVLQFALKNIIVPVATIILLDFGSYLGGAVVTESVFAWPGIGRALVVAVSKRDIPVIQGIILFGTLLFIMIGVLIDYIQIRTIHKQ